MESQLSSARHKMEILEMELNQRQTEKIISEQELNNKIDNLNDTIKNFKETISEKEKEISNLQQQLSLERAVNESEKRQNVSQVNQFTFCSAGIIATK